MFQSISLIIDKFLIHLANKSRFDPTISSSKLNLFSYVSSIYHQSKTYHSLIGISGSIAFSHDNTLIAAVDQLHPLKLNVIVCISHVHE
jgi:hypothetical protein